MKRWLPQMTILTQPAILVLGMLLLHTAILTHRSRMERWFPQTAILVRVGTGNFQKHLILLFLDSSTSGRFCYTHIRQVYIKAT